MAVPSAIIRRREQLKAQAEAAASPVEQTIEQAPVTTEQQIEPVSPPSENEEYVDKLEVLNDKLADAVTPEELATARADVQALKDKYSTALGRVTAESHRANNAELQLSVRDTEFETIKSRLAEADTERAELKRLEALRVQAAQLAELDLDDPDVSDEDLAAMDQSDTKLIRALSKKTMAPAIKRVIQENIELKQRLDLLEKSTADVAPIHEVLKEQKAAKSRDAERAQLSKELTPVVPDWEAVVSTPEWKTFLATPVSPDSSTLHGHLIASYRASKHVPGIAGLFMKFKDANQSTGLDKITTPGKSTADRAASPTPKPRMKTSEYMVFHRKSLSSGRDPEFVKSYAAYKARFNEAHKDGRVDDDAKIFNR